MGLSIRKKFTTSLPGPQRIAFDKFEIDLRSGELRKNGARLRLQAQPFRLLTLLIEHAGEVVTREEICAELWPGNTFVDFEHGLAAAVNKIREVLGDTAASPKYIETLPKRGYRFLGEVKTAPAKVAAIPPAAEGVELASVPGREEKEGKSFWPGYGKRSGVLLVGTAVVASLVLIFGLRGVRGRLSEGGGSARIQSIAVLPLVNLSSDEGQDYFADGMTEELTNELGKITALRVVSRTSAMQYKDAKKPLREIARELNVDALLEGAVTRSGNRAHITVNLVQPSPERHLWTEAYDTDAEDTLIVERHVAEAVAKEMRVALAPRAAPSPASHLVNPEAHDLYFRGVHAIRSGGAGATRRAIGYYQQAIQKDPNFAQAYCGLAMAYAIWYPGDPGPRENMPKAREAGAKALALDDSLAGAHMALAYVAMSYDWNWAEAEKEFRRALQLDASNALARNFYARELVALGRTEEAVSQAARAVELEPYGQLDLPAWIYYLAHRYEESLQLAQKMVAMDPNFSWGRWALAANYEQLGKPKESSEEYLRFETLSATNAKRIQRLRAGLEKSGAKGFWQASLEDYQETAKSTYAPPVLVAGACVRLGDKACAYKWLEKGFKERDDLMIDLKVDPVFDGIRDDPRFQDLMRRVGLP